MFHIGQEIEWIGPKDISPRADAPYPPRKTPLIVSWTGKVWGRQVIEVKGWPSPETKFYYRGWRATYFRPVIRRTTDISIFTALLNSTKVDA